MPPRALAQPEFLPMTQEELRKLGWEHIDVLLVTGDAYIDHPSFGAPLLGRWLVSYGFRVGLAAQPRWDTDEDMLRLGRPRLFAGVSAGALDSQLAHYTAFRKKRSDDAYTPGGKAGARPNRAALVYTNLLKKAFPGLPIVLGGIEASLRRAVYYDFWSDSLRRSLLLDSKADAVLYGMAEASILALAQELDAQGAHTPPTAPLPGSLLARIDGTAFIERKGDALPFRAADEDVVALPSFESIQDAPEKLIESTLLLERQVHQNISPAVQEHGGRKVWFTRPGEGLSTQELDALYDLPFTRAPHPSYSERIPAAEMIESSICTHRGCGGGCSFCALALHQGRAIRSRSRASILREAKRLTRNPRFKGAVSDVGGPSANMWRARCSASVKDCRRQSCLAPTLCKHFLVDQGEYVKLLRDVAAIPGVKHVRVASGLRFDLALQAPKALEALVRDFVGGQLKLAPEHMAEHVLKLMRKPGFARFEEFLDRFETISRSAGKKQFIVPYLMSAFPGCTDEDMGALKAWLDRRGWRPQQVQCFIPLPGTLAAAMYFAEKDPAGRRLSVAKTDAARLRQHARLVPIGRTGKGKKGAATKPPQRKKKRPAPKPKKRGVPR